MHQVTYSTQDLATVVITTKNRKDELRTAIRSALSQTLPVKVLLIDDGSTDGTTEMVRAEFPQVRLERSAESLGYIAQRNRAARLATTAFVFSIDDDAEFASSHTIEQTLADFQHPRVGAVAIPYIEPGKANMVLQRAPAREGTWVTDSYVGTAHAVRRELFLKLSGYRASLVHQGEEGDFCVRLLQAGWLVRLGRGNPIHHHESPRRDSSRMDFYGRRNDVLFAWHNVPTSYFPIHLLGTTLNGLLFGVRCGRFARMARGIAAGYVECWRARRERQPVSVSTYRLHRHLKKCGPMRLEDIEAQLPPLSSAHAISRL